MIRSETNLDLNGKISTFPISAYSKSSSNGDTMKLKAISIVYPSGSKIANGEKTIEVRTCLPTIDLGQDLLIVENHKFDQSLVK